MSTSPSTSSVVVNADSSGRISFWNQMIFFGKDIKLSHSIFALPFAMLAAFLAAAARPIYAPTLSYPIMLALIIWCMVTARTVAMAVNRLADASADAQNPRTKNRALPAGQLSCSFYRLIIAAGTILFIAGSSGFYFWNNNPWPLWLSPVALGWLCAYSYTKRFTWLCHLWLGSSLALSPIAAIVAIEPSYLNQSAPWYLAVMVLCWVAGFDIIYALQDVEIDQKLGLHSMPANLGVAQALWISRGLHLTSFLALVALAQTSPHLHQTFSWGIGIVAVLLLLEHGLIWRSTTHHIHLAFFTLNGIISVLLGSLGIYDILR